MKTNTEHESPAIHLVVRFSDRVLKVESTIAEHKNVLNKLGTVWFGKLGQPVGKQNIAKINRQIESGIPTYLYLVQKIDKKYSIYRGRINEVATECPAAEKDRFPPYYFDAMDVNEIRFWVKLSDLMQVDQPEFSKLSSVTSSENIIGTLGSSMAGFFVVREVQRFSPTIHE